MKNIIFWFITMHLSLFTSCAKDDKTSPVMNDKILKITIGERELTATLYDNPTTRDFIKQLPLTVDLDDYAASEKIFYPSQKLSVSQRYSVSDPSIGDINVYAPWGNIAIFYKSYRASRDLIRIGRIDNGMEVMSQPGTISNVKFELTEI